VGSQRTPPVIIDPMKCSALPCASMLATRLHKSAQPASIFVADTDAGIRFHIHKPEFSPLKKRPNRYCRSTSTYAVRAISSPKHLRFSEYEYRFWLGLRLPISPLSLTTQGATPNSHPALVCTWKESANLRFIFLDDAHSCQCGVAYPILPSASLADCILTRPPGLVAEGLCS
jgi:hypothetical protein